jgi:hypothetical protein
VFDFLALQLTGYLVDHVQGAGVGRPCLIWQNSQPVHDERRAFYWILGLIELSAVERYTTRVGDQAHGRLLGDETPGEGTIEVVKFDAY